MLRRRPQLLRHIKNQKITRVVSGARQLRWFGPGTLTLSGNNTYTGGTVLTTGTIRFSVVEALPDTGTCTIRGVGSLPARIITDGFPFAGGSRSIVVENQGTGTATIELTTGNKAINGTVVLNKATIFEGTNPTGGAYIRSVISGNPGTVTFRSVGGGSLYGNAANTFAGNVLLTQGGVYVFSAGCFGVNNPLIMSGTAALLLYSAGPTIGALTGAVGNTINTSANGPRTLAITSTTAATFAGVISGLGNVTKSGTGNQTFSGNNTYSGGTTINAGAMTAGHNNAFGTGTITINAGGTLNRNGFTLPNVVVNLGGTDNP